MPGLEGIAGRVQGFAALLRQNGVAVSVAELLDAYRALELVGLADPHGFRAALRAAFVKDAEAHRLFDELFALYFGWPPAGAPAGPAPAATGEHPVTGGGVPQLAPEALEQLSELARAIAQGDSARAEIAIRRAADAAGIDAGRSSWQEGFYRYKVLEELDATGARQEVAELAAALRNQGRHEEAAVVEQRLARFEAAVAEHVRRRLQQRDLALRARLRRDLLWDRSFYRASPEELAAMRREVQRLAQRLRTRLALRRKRARRGSLHVQETVRANLQTGLVPFRLRRRRRHRLRPELVVLVDLSESVRAASEFMLMFVHALADQFERVRVFGFVAETAELTDLLRRRSFERAFAEVMRSDRLHLYVRSDYGAAFRSFFTRYGDAVTPRATLVVLGDARSNYQPHEPELVRRLARRARWSLWLNPEPHGSWGLGDSVMPDYQPAFRTVATVGNLRQLAAVVERLVVHL